MRLTSLFVLSACLLTPLLAQATTSGNLIKGSQPSVYYLGQDQKRHAFPNEQVYKSWYTDFSEVRTISDQELATYSLGANVTYKPGTRLVKITTDPKVYAVARGGVLRWVESENIAQTLYGSQWARQVDDIPDSFFSNYRVGEPIRSTNDFVPTQERDASPSIDTNQGVTSAPTPTSPTPQPSAPTSTSPSNPVPISPAFRIGIQTSPTTPIYGQPFTLRIEATPANEVLSVNIYLDNGLIKRCEYYICASEILIPITDTQPSHEARIEVLGTNGRSTTSTLQLPATGGNPNITLLLRQAQIETNGYREIIAQVASNFLARDLDIYLDGGRIRSCGSLQECRYSERETSPVGTTHTVFAIATDRNGTSIRSETKTISVVTNDSPLIEITPDKTVIYPNEQMDVSITANDDDGIQQTNLSIDGIIIKTCRTPTCRATIGPWSAPRTVVVEGSATDQLGAHSSATSSLITVRLP